MAINFKDLKEKIKTAPLSTLELELIKQAEEYIDEEILKQYDKTCYHEVNIDLCIANFNYSHLLKKSIDNVGSIRKSLMRTELDSRYKKAGWVISYHIDDGLDGPNMSGGDYWILKGK